MYVVRAEDWLVIIGFVLAFVCLYSCAGFLLVRRFISPKERAPRLGALGYCVLFLAALCLIPIAYSFYEPYRIEVTHYQLPVKGLAGPIRLVHLSDTHCDGEKRLEDEIPRLVRQEHPDLIAFTGDAINSEEGIANFKELIGKLKQIAPVYAVKGDWDYSVKRLDVLRDSGANVLRSSAEVIDIRGAQLRIAGESISEQSNCRPFIDQLPQGIPTVFLYHKPDADVVRRRQTDGIDLYLCGHTHGGQIALPFYGALITQSRLGKMYESGLHKINDMWIYTSRGIGMEGHFPRVRFCAVPEIAVFDLVPS